MTWWQKNRALVAFMVLGLVNAAGFVLMYDLIQDNAKSREFLCAQEENLGARLEAGEDLDLDLLAERLGVPAALLRDSRTRDETTYQEMQALDCPPKEIP